MKGIYAYKRNIVFSVRENNCLIFDYLELFSLFTLYIKEKEFCY